MAPHKLLPEELTGVTWRISSRSPSGGGSCVEAGPLCDGSGRVAVRHSHHPTGAALLASRSSWAALTARVRAGEFDFPAT